jgi:UDP-N-acetylmuramoyl-tripeptide--D-alanyl-D-alanine ligase
MIYNALAAVSTGELFGLSIKEIVEGIQTVSTVGSRSNIITNEKYTIIDDCYSANPLSMRAALDLLATAKTRTVAIIGDMGELGTEAKILHEKIGEYARKKNIDLLVFVGKMSKYAAEAAKKMKNVSTSNIFYFSNKEEFLKEMETILKEKDTILVKASNTFEFCEIVKRIK